MLKETTQFWNSLQKILKFRVLIGVSKKIPHQQGKNQAKDYKFYCFLLSVIKSWVGSFIFLFPWFWMFCAKF